MDRDKSLSCLLSAMALLLISPVIENAWAELSDYDPTVRGNKTGIIISTPIKKPIIWQQKTNSPSGLTVMTWSVDEDGYILQSSRTDLKAQPNGRRAALRHYPNGRAYWEMGGHPYYANPRYNNGLAQQNTELAQAQQLEQLQKMQMIKNLGASNDGFQQFTPEQLEQAVKNMSDDELNKNIMICQSLIAQQQIIGLPNTDGFQRFVKFARLDVDRRFQDQGEAAKQELAAVSEATLGTHFAPNLGIEYLAIILPNQNWGLKLTQDAPANTPAGKIGLEAGDMITELDGQALRSEDDVRMHVESTSVRFINVRDGSDNTQTTFIPN